MEGNSILHVAYFGTVILQNPMLFSCSLYFPDTEWRESGGSPGLVQFSIAKRFFLAILQDKVSGPNSLLLTLSTGLIGQLDTLVKYVTSSVRG